MIRKASRRHGPIVLSGRPMRRKLRAQPQPTLLGGCDSEPPMPGELLVLLSQLHRAQSKTMPEKSED